MAARRGKSQARRSGGGNNGLPGWAWLVIGVLLTLLLLVLAPKFIGNGEGGGFFRIGPHADADAVPKGSNETDGAFDPGSTAQELPQLPRSSCSRRTGSSSRGR